MADEPVTLENPIEERIARAEHCHHAMKDYFFGEPVVRELLERLRRALREASDCMVRTGITEICRECDLQEGGSCCGAGLEDYYGVSLLLINLLLGVTLPSGRMNASSCYFLGKRGCLLQARHVICVNYICKKITSQIDSTALAGLREKEGRALELLFRLNEEIIRRLREKGASGWRDESGYEA
ncbi:MAG: hypothetical protein JRH13_02885 [Deltaproteobacteria bacterium]|nr:hypothetical protein [Deltaproteobacteria bacterium]